MKLNILLAIFTVLLLSMNASSQITYSNGKLNINQAENDSIFSLTINKWLGMKWTCKKKNFLQIDVSPNNPRIAGTGDAVTLVKRKGWALNYNTIIELNYRLFKSENQYLFAQYYNGYGEGLLEYKRFHSMFRVGIVIKPRIFSDY
ncbi:MAG: phospholipase A [Firmicutes bacterium]|nr:phospholipase A [Bacillota bacterium]MCM1400590.1 phospholipase A [Bacteroides sp.]MCM1477483.1 phospholipase A [Bacteroides sp.]